MPLVVLFCRPGAVVIPVVIVSNEIGPTGIGFMTYVWAKSESGLLRPVVRDTRSAGRACSEW